MFNATTKELSNLMKKTSGDDGIAVSEYRDNIRGNKDGREELTPTQYEDLKDYSPSNLS